MHSFKLNNGWEQLTNRMAAWGLKPTHNNYLVELIVEQTNDTLYTILFRTYPDDNVQYNVVADVPASEYERVKELVQYFAFHVAQNERRNPTEPHPAEFTHITPKTPSEDLQRIREFLTIHYTEPDDTWMNNTQHRTQPIPSTLHPDA